MKVLTKYGFVNESAIYEQDSETLDSVLRKMDAYGRCVKLGIINEDAKHNNHVIALNESEKITVSNILYEMKMQILKSAYESHGIILDEDLFNKAVNEGILDSAKGFVKKSKEFFAGATTKATETIKDVNNKIKDVVKDNKIVQKFQAGYDFVCTAISKNFSDVKEVVKFFEDFIEKFGKSLRKVLVVLGIFDKEDDINEGEEISVSANLNEEEEPKDVKDEGNMKFNDFIDTSKNNKAPSDDEILNAQFKGKNSLKFVKGLISLFKEKSKDANDTNESLVYEEEAIGLDPNLKDLDDSIGAKAEKKSWWGKIGKGIKTAASLVWQFVWGTLVNGLIMQGLPALITTIGMMIKISLSDPKELAKDGVKLLANEGLKKLGNAIFKYATIVCTVIAFVVSAYKLYKAIMRQYKNVKYRSAEKFWTLPFCLTCIVTIITLVRSASDVVSTFKSVAAGGGTKSVNVESETTINTEGQTYEQVKQQIDTGREKIDNEIREDYKVATEKLKEKLGLDAVWCTFNVFMLIKQVIVKVTEIVGGGFAKALNVSEDQFLEILEFGCNLSGLGEAFSRLQFDKLFEKEPEIMVQISDIVTSMPNDASADEVNEAISKVMDGISKSGDPHKATFMLKYLAEQWSGPVTTMFNCNVNLEKVQGVIDKVAKENGWENISFGTIGEKGVNAVAKGSKFFIKTFFIDGKPANADQITTIQNAIANSGLKPESGGALNFNIVNLGAASKEVVNSAVKVTAKAALEIPMSNATVLGFLPTFKENENRILITPTGNDDKEFALSYSSALGNFKEMEIGDLMKIKAIQNKAGLEDVIKGFEENKKEAIKNIKLALNNDELDEDKKKELTEKLEKAKNLDANKEKIMVLFGDEEDVDSKKQKSTKTNESVGRLGAWLKRKIQHEIPIIALSYSTMTGCDLMDSKARNKSWGLKDLFNNITINPVKYNDGETMELVYKTLTAIIKYSAVRSYELFGPYCIKTTGEKENVKYEIIDDKAGEFVIPSTRNKGNITLTELCKILNSSTGSNIEEIKKGTDDKEKNEDIYKMFDQKRNISNEEIDKEREKFKKEVMPLLDSPSSALFNACISDDYIRKYIFIEIKDENIEEKKKTINPEDFKFDEKWLEDDNFIKAIINPMVTFNLRFERTKAEILTPEFAKRHNWMGYKKGDVDEEKMRAIKYSIMAFAQLVQRLRTSKRADDPIVEVSNLKGHLKVTNGSNTSWKDDYESDLDLFKEQKFGKIKNITNKNGVESLSKHLKTVSDKPLDDLTVMVMYGNGMDSNEGKIYSYMEYLNEDKKKLHEGGEEKPFIIFCYDTLTAIDAQNFDKEDTKNKKTRQNDWDIRGLFSHVNIKPYEKNDKDTMKNIYKMLTAILKKSVITIVRNNPEFGIMYDKEGKRYKSSEENVKVKVEEKYKDYTESDFLKILNSSEKDFKQIYKNIFTDSKHDNIKNIEEKDEWLEKHIYPILSSNLTDIYGDITGNENLVEWENEDGDKFVKDDKINVDFIKKDPEISFALYRAMFSYGEDIDKSWNEYIPKLFVRKSKLEEIKKKKKNRNIISLVNIIWEYREDPQRWASQMKKAGIKNSSEKAEKAVVSKKEIKAAKEETKKAINSSEGISKTTTVKRAKKWMDGTFLKNIKGEFKEAIKELKSNMFVKDGKIDIEALKKPEIRNTLFKICCNEVGKFSSNKDKREKYFSKNLVDKLKKEGYDENKAKKTAESIEGIYDVVLKFRSKKGKSNESYNFEDAPSNFLKESRFTLLDFESFKEFI